MREDLKSGALDGGPILCFPCTFGFRAGNLYGLEKLWALLTYFKGPFPTTVSADLQQEIAKHTADFKVRVAFGFASSFRSHPLTRRKRTRHDEHCFSPEICVL